MAESSNRTDTEEIRCPKCGYNLFGLSEFRCPECGTPFDPKKLAAQTHLLPWERPELGGKLRRLSRTILLASLHPDRYFSAICQRKDRPILNAGSFVTACILASISFYLVSFFLGPVIFFIRLAWKHGATQKILHSAVSLLRIYASTDWYFPIMQVLTMLFSIFLIAMLVTRMFRNRIGGFQTKDIAVVLSPTITFGAFIAAFCQVVLAISQYSLLWILGGVMLCGQVVVLLLLVWHCCRKALALSRAKTVAMVITCGILQYGCAMGASFVLSQIRLAILL